MKLKVGDKVKFLNEKGEGTVTKIISKNSVGVTVEDGFEIPFNLTELLLINPAGHTEPAIQVERTIQKKAADAHGAYQTAKKNMERKEAEGIYLAFSPEKIKDIAHSDMNVWLINHTGYKILFSYSILNEDMFSTLETGGAESFESVLLETIEKTELQEATTFKLDVLFYNEKDHDQHPPFSGQIRLKPIKLYKDNAFAENSFISEKSLVIEVYKMEEMPTEDKLFSPRNDLSQILFQKRTHSDAPKKSKPHSNNNPEKELEIDLHIEELMDDYSRMSNAEIIQVQLKHFQQALDRAIADHYRKLTVIHGVGNGRLRQEVRNIISANSSLRFYDGSYSKYGFGATEISIS
ncbi:MAG: DUF2027 domain-containing protein [Bacteroidota bacterium]|nr:DUF2027 domain-containing protein [Bacteroidota bacterium]